MKQNPNVTPSSHPTKFCGLLAMVAPTAHITQQNFLIGSFLKIEFFIGQDDIIDISVPIQSLLTRFSLCMPLTHIYMSCISQFCGRIFKHTIFNILYDGKRNMKHNTFPSFRNCVTTEPVSHHSFPNLHHIQFTEYIFRNPSHFFQKESITA